MMSSHEIMMEAQLSQAQVMVLWKLRWWWVNVSFWCLRVEGSMKVQAVGDTMVGWQHLLKRSEKAAIIFTVLQTKAHYPAGHILACKFCFAVLFNLTCFHSHLIKKKGSNFVWSSEILRWASEFYSFWTTIMHSGILLRSLAQMC